MSEKVIAGTEHQFRPGDIIVFSDGEQRVVTEVTSAKVVMTSPLSWWKRIWFSFRRWLRRWWL